MNRALIISLKIVLVILTTMDKTTLSNAENAQIVIQAKNFERNAEIGIMYGHFRKHEFHRLSPRGRYRNITDITKPIECTKNCLIEFWCWSYNLERQSKPDGSLLCEILSTHKYENESNGEFQRNGNFDHYSIQVCRIIGVAVQ